MRCPWCQFEGVPDGSHFCSRCGTSMPTAAPPAAPAWQPAPIPSPFSSPAPWPSPAAPATVVPGPPPGRSGPEAVPPLDWASAARTAGIALAVLAGVPVILAVVVLVASPQLGLGGLIGVVLGGIASSLGGSVEFSAGVGGVGASASSSFMPLTGTAVGLVVLGTGFVRGLPRDAVPGPASTRVTARQGLLTLGLFVGGALLAAIIGGAALDGALAGGLAGTVAGVHVGVGVLSTVVGSALLGAGTLALAVVWARPDLLPPQVVAARRVLVGPALAVRFTLVLWAALTVLGWVVSVLVAATRGPEDAGVGIATFAVLVLLLPNAVFTSLGFGSGVPLTLDVPGLGGLALSAAGVPTSFGLGDAAAFSSVVWLLPVLIAITMLAGALHAVVTTPARTGAPMTAWVLGPVWGVVLFVGALLSGLHTSASGSVPVLGQADVGLDVHLSYALVLVVGLVWGLVAGVAGRALASVLPDRLTATFDGRLTRRRATTITGVVVAICLLSVSTAWAGSGPGGWGAPTAPTTSAAPVTTSGAPQTADPTFPTATTTEAPTVSPSGLVTLGASASSDPHAATVSTVLDRYFTAINSDDYTGWSGVVTPRMASDQPRSTWEKGYRTTRDDQITVDDITASGSGDVLATVRFRSTQDPSDAPRDMQVPRICWQMTYPIDTTTAQVGPPAKSSITRQVC